MATLDMKLLPMEESLLAFQQSPDIVDRVAAMRHQEVTTYRVEDYMTPSTLFCRRVDEESRLKMCEWCYQVVDQFGIDRESVAIAMNYLDRFVATNEGKPLLNDLMGFQLAAVTCLTMSFKIFYEGQLDPAVLVDSSKGCYTEEDIAAMEKVILSALQWRTQGPTAFSFVQHFLALLPSSLDSAVKGAIMENVRFQTELSVCDYDLIRENPSTIAVACIVNALNCFDDTVLPWTARREFINAVECLSGVTCDQVEAVGQYINFKLTQRYCGGIKAMLMEGIDQYYDEGVITEVDTEQQWNVRCSGHQPLSPVAVSAL